MVHDPVLQLSELAEIDDTGNFIGIEHPVHRCFEEFNGDLSRDHFSRNSRLSPDTPLGKRLGIAQFLSLRRGRLLLKEIIPSALGKPGSPNSFP